MTDQSASPELVQPNRAADTPPVPRERLWRDLLGRELRTLRRDRQETLEAVAHRANLSLQYLSEVERGAKEPSSEIVAAIGAALGTTLLDLTEAVAEQLRADRDRTAVRTARDGFSLAA